MLVHLVDSTNTELNLATNHFQSINYNSVIKIYFGPFSLKRSSQPCFGAMISTLSPFCIALWHDIVKAIRKLNAHHSA